MGGERRLLPEHAFDGQAAAVAVADVPDHPTDDAIHTPTGNTRSDARL